MKKKKFLSSVIAVIIALITVVAVTTTAAEYAADDGMTFDIITTKSEYGVNEEVQIILLAKNYNPNMKMANITWNATVPGGELTFLSGDLTGTQKVEVGERAAINLRLMKIVEIQQEEPPVEDTPTDPVTEEETEEGPSAGEIAVLIVLILLVLAGIAGIVYLVIKRRGGASCIALLLALGTALSCVPAMDVSAALTNVGDVVLGEDGTLSASVKFVVDGTEYEATATMSYTMEKQTETVVEAMHSSMSAYEWEVYNDPTVTPTVGQHPRLYFTEKDIPDIIANLESEECKDIANEFYSFLGTSFNGSFSTLTDEQKEKGSSNYDSKKLMSIRCKALYYALYKNSEDESKASMAQYYGKTAVRAIQRAMETISFSAGIEGYDNYSRGDFQCAAAEVYDWCYDLLTYEDKQNIASMAQQIGMGTESQWPLKITNTVTSHYGGDLIQGYWMAMAIAMYDEYPTMYEFVGGVYFQEYLPPRNVWNVSGAHHQGASYGVAGRNDCDMSTQMMIFQMTGGANDYNGDGITDGIYTLDEVAGEMGYSLLYSMRPDGQLLREGDVWEENQTDKYTIWDAGAIAMERLANLYKNGIYRRLAHEMSGGLVFTNENAMMALIMHDPDVESETYYNLPYTKYFPYPSGSMIARTGWDMGTASDDVIVKMQLTPVYVDNHQHRDAGAFQIYYKGILASESGYYVYYNTAHDIQYHKSSIAHNTLAITSIHNRYGKQINAYVSDWGVEGKQETVTTLIGEEYGPNVNKPEYSYLAGDIGATYRNEGYDENTQEAVRSMLFLNLSLDGNTEYPGAFIVFDQITTLEVGSRKTFMLHTQSEPEIDGNVVIVKNVEDDYNGKLTNQVLYVGTANQTDDAYTITAIGGADREFVVGNYNYSHTNTITSDLCQEQGWGRVEVSTTTTQTNQTDYLLNVMYVSDADGSTKVVPATLVYDGKGVLMGAQLMNHVAMFNMDGNNRISKTTTFTIPASDDYETFKVNVAGLKAGTWAIYVDGKAVGTQVASEEGGMIYFEAVAGTVKLVYSDTNSNKTFDETPNTDVEPIGLMINNFYYYTDAHPVQSGDDYLVPVSVVFDALNGKGKWNKDQTQYTVQFMGKEYVFTESSITIDGTAVEFKEMRLENGDFLLDMTTLGEMVAGEGEIYYDAYIHDIRVDVVVENAIPELSQSILDEFPNAVQVEAVIDNGYSTLPMTNVLDDDPTTRWTTQESGGKISEGVFDLGKVVSLTEIKIKFWTEETLYSNYVFDIYVSEDGSEYIPLYENIRSGEVSRLTCSDTWVTFILNCDARYVKLVGHGRTTYTVSGKPPASVNNTWFIPTEVVFLQKAIIDPDGAELVGSRLQAEAECFHMNNGTVVKNQDALSKEEVQLNLGSKANPGSASGTTAQLSASFIPKVTAPHYIWVRVNTSKVTSGDTMWVNIEGITGDKYYAENVKTGKTDSDGYRWIKLGQYESQVALSEWTAGEKYKLSVISGCEGLVVDCFMVSSDPSYVPYEACTEKKTSTSGEVKVNAKDAIFEYSVATASGTGAKLQAVSADGSASKEYIEYILSTKNLPGDISLNICTDTSGIFKVYATVKASSLSKDQFFYAVSTNDDDYKYKLVDLSEDFSGVTAGQFVTITLGEIEIQADESIYVRFKACSADVTVGTIFTTCELPSGVYPTTNGKLTIQAEDATLSQPGEENTIVRNGVYCTTDTTQIVDSTGATGGKAVKLVETFTAWNQMETYTNEPNAHISFRIMPDTTDEYYIWIKVYAPEGSAIYAFIEGSDDYYYWRQPLTLETYSVESEEYVWVRLSQEWRNTIKVYAEHAYQLTARRLYTVNLRSNTGGVRVDEIFISNNINDAPHNHTYADTWSTDGTHHWYAVTCGCKNVEPRFYAEHFYEDHTDKECNTCGYKNPDYAPHNYVDGKCTICGGLPPFTTSNGKLTVEAEDMMMAEDGTENIASHMTGTIIKISDNDAAEGGKAAETKATYSAWNIMSTSGTTPIPHLHMLVTPDKTGQYYIWVRVQTPKNVSYLNDAIYCCIEGGSDTYYWRQPLMKEDGSHSEGNSDFYWVLISEQWNSDSLMIAEHTYNWKAGETYKVRFRTYSSGVKIDQIYITNSATDIPHDHTYSSVYQKDDTNHWRVATCEHTDKVIAKAAHDYTDLLDTTCNTCGYERPPHEHSYSEFYRSDAASHWYQCECGHKKDVTSHSYVDDVCSTCGRHAVFSTSGGKVTIEAEDSLLAQKGSENTASTSTAAVSTGVLAELTDNANASGGKTVTFKNTNSNAQYVAKLGTYPIPHASVDVKADVTGEYYIWVKVYTAGSWSSVYTDGVYCLIGDDNGTDTYYWRQPLTKADGAYSDSSQDFYWVRVYQEYYKGDAATGIAQVGANKSYHWTAGKTYTLNFRTYTSGVQIDQIYVTTDPNDVPHCHSYKTTWQYDETYHWHDSVCGCTDLVSDKAEHTFGAAWSTDGEYHWYECECGAQKDKAVHTFADGKCSGCGTPEPFESENGKVVIQAEDGTLAQIGEENYLNTLYASTSSHYTNVTTTAPMQVKTNAAGAALECKWTFNVSYGLLKQGTNPNAHVSYNVKADTTGEVYIWLKVYTPMKASSNYQEGIYCLIEDDNGTDTCYWRQPLAKEDGTYSESETDFYWVRLEHAYHAAAIGKAETAYGEDKVYNWTAGQVYTLCLRSMSAYTQIDEIYVTTDPADPYTKNHVHDYGTEYKSDEDTHWQACTCGKVTVSEAHTYTDDQDAFCNTCNYEREVHIHNYGTVWFTDGTNHWRECACGLKSELAAHTYQDGLCTGCKTVEGLVPPTGVSIVVDYDGYVGTEWASKLDLPAQVTVNGVAVDVVWEDAAAYVDPDTVGMYAVPGTVNGIEKAVYFPVQVRAYSNLLINYNSSLETAKFWSLRNNSGFVTSPVIDGTYATNQVLPSTWTKTGGQVAYSYDGQSAAYADLVTAAGAGEYWFGVWGQVGADSVTNEVNTNLALNVSIYRTTTAQTTSTISYDSTRRLTGSKVTLNGESYTRVGLVATLDGTDEHLRFFVNGSGEGIANDLLHLDNIELVALKITLN